MPPLQLRATQVLLVSPHHTGLSLGPSLAWLHLLEDRVCSCLFSHKFVESLFVLGVGFTGVSKADVIWSTVK